MKRIRRVYSLVRTLRLEDTRNCLLWKAQGGNVIHNGVCTGGWLDFGHTETARDDSTQALKEQQFTSLFTQAWLYV